jgi:hypothetical protein
LKQGDRVTQAYHVAVFTPDGALEGTGTQPLADLSRKWLDFCSAMLRAHEPSFRASLGGPLQHLEVKLTSAAGDAIGTFYTHGQTAVSTLYLGGQSGPAEHELTAMFVASLRRSMPPQAPGLGGSAFAEVHALDQRPLHVVVVWANPTVADEDYDLLREFSTHFAAAFFSGARASA